MRIPVTLSPESLRSWHFHALDTAQDIKREYERLSESSEKNPVMKAFPMNEGSCFKYGKTCPYLLMCESWANPLAHQGRIPADLKYREKFNK